MDNATREEIFEKYKEIWKHSIPRNYNSELEKFKEFNLSASESDFLEIHLSQTEKHVEGLKQRIDFNDDPEEDLTERPNLYDYWYYKSYLDYIKDKRPVNIKTVNADFRAYLSDIGIKALPVILERYRDAKPKRLALMLHCLGDFGLLSVRIEDVVQDNLTEAVKGEFGIKNLTRQALFYGVDRYNHPNSAELSKLKEEKIILNDLIKGL